VAQWNIRLLDSGDVVAVERIYHGSEWVSAHFVPAELPRLLATQPAVGAFDRTGTQLLAFLLATSLIPPCAWMGGFGVAWSEHRQSRDLLDALLPRWRDLVCSRGATRIYYSGFDPDNDWLRAPLLAYGFRPIMLLRSYDKFDYLCPGQGNQDVLIRDFAPDDLPALLDIENAAFEPLWRHDAAEFLDIAAEYPFFVVAVTTEGEVAGYQFSSCDGGLGYLVRIAVHPHYQGQGVATRLMAESMRYFAAQHVHRILLNTEEANTRAHRLYEWFGFALVEPRGYVMEWSTES
jgi:[ribosomal protein S18]-alanine N-acetyltransferase